jgi:hypothetical protein
VARTKVANCTVATADACELSVAAASDTALFNNLVVDAGTGMVVGGANKGLAVDYNLCLAFLAGKIEGELQRPSVPTWRDVSGGLDAHSVQLNVTFADPANHDFHVVSALAWEPGRATTSGWLMARDTNGDGRIDASDASAKPVLDVDGKPVSLPLWSRFTWVNPDGTIQHTGAQILMRWKLKGIDGHQPLGKAKPPEVVIKRLPGPLTIDGDTQKWRRLGFPPQVLLTPQNSYGKIDGPLDLSGVIRLGYHGRDLYAAIIVFDNVVSFHQPASRFYQGDSFQFCINGFLTGFGFNVAQTTDRGTIFLRNRFFFQTMDLYLDPARAPRVIKKFATAADIPERQYIESVYGVDLSKSPGYIIELKLPLDESTYKGDEKIVPAVAPGKWFWLGFMLNDNDMPGTDVQNFIFWPGSFGIFNPAETGPRAFFE